MPENSRFPAKKTQIHFKNLKIAIGNIEFSNMKSSSFKKAVTGAKAAPAKAPTSAPVDQMTAPKNIVLFIGDDMGEAIRYEVGKNGTLKMDNMPIMGLVCTSSSDLTVASSEEQFYIDSTTEGHSAVDVALTAMSPCAEQFPVNYQNTAIYDKLAKLLKLK